jgi:hypothetical protein
MKEKDRSHLIKDNSKIDFNSRKKKSKDKQSDWKTRERSKDKEMKRSESNRNRKGKDRFMKLISAKGKELTAKGDNDSNMKDNKGMNKRNSEDKGKGKENSFKRLPVFKNRNKRKQ